MVVAAMGRVNILFLFYFDFILLLILILFHFFEVFFLFLYFFILLHFTLQKIMYLFKNYEKKLLAALGHHRHIIVI